ncbi:MAG: NAD(P)H-dependent glycerol-3-phosphate dehydrogenase, partial [Rhizomicrobium sp.]
MTQNVEKNRYDKIGVIGAGAWGTALALTAARAGRTVTLWAREPELAAAMAKSHENSRFLPGITLPPTIMPTSDLAMAARADALLLVSPAQHLRSMLQALTAVTAEGVPLALCAKGIELGSGRLLTEILSETAPNFIPAVLSGPSFAADSARELPTAVTIAATPAVAEGLQTALSHAAFRPYVSDDIIGVALGGAAKNVYAIASGIVDGLGLGESARAALIARSFAELRRLGEALGARPETLMGLSGLGDLVLTATSPQSRNYSFGIGIGQGKRPQDLSAPGAPLAEGAATAPALLIRAKAEGIELP